MAPQIWVPTTDLWSQPLWAWELGLRPFPKPTPITYLINWPQYFNFQALPPLHTHKQTHPHTCTHLIKSKSLIIKATHLGLLLEGHSCSLLTPNFICNNQHFFCTILSFILSFTFELHNVGDCLPRWVAQPRPINSHSCYVIFLFFYFSLFLPSTNEEAVRKKNYNIRKKKQIRPILRVTILGQVYVQMFRL